MSSEDRQLFEKACGDSDNVHAQVLLDAFGVTSAPEVLKHLSESSIDVVLDLVMYVFRAVELERERASAN